MSNHTDDDCARGDWEYDQMKDRRMEEMREREQAELAKIPTPITDAALEKTWQSVNVPTNAIPAEVAGLLERRLVVANKQLTLACLRERAALDDYRYQKEKADDALLLLAESERGKQSAVESAHKRGMIESARLRGHITKMAGWIKQVRCQCSERSVCARCMALACSEVDSPLNGGC